MKVLVVRVECARADAEAVAALQLAREEMNSTQLLGKRRTCVGPLRRADTTLHSASTRVSSQVSAALACSQLRERLLRGSSVRALVMEKRPLRLDSHRLASDTLREVQRTPNVMSKCA